mgnify:CR=1 FL=1
MSAENRVHLAEFLIEGMRAHIHNLSTFQNQPSPISATRRLDRITTAGFSTCTKLAQYLELCRDDQKFYEHYVRLGCETIGVYCQTLCSVQQVLGVEPDPASQRTEQILTDLRLIEQSFPKLSA